MRVKGMEYLMVLRRVDKSSVIRYVFFSLHAFVV